METNSFLFPATGRFYYLSVAPRGLGFSIPHPVIPSVVEESRGNENGRLFFPPCSLQCGGVDSPDRGNGACAKRVAAAAERGWRASAGERIVA